MRKSICAGILISALSIAAVPSAADATATINVVQNGSNVVATASGSFNFSGIGAVQAGSANTGVTANPINIGIGPSGFTYQYFADGPQSLGTGSSRFLPTSTTGTIVTIIAAPIATDLFRVLIGVPYPNTSGAIDATSTFANTTISGLGLTPGSYVFTFAAAPNFVADTLTVNIGASNQPAVPEPATWTMMLLGFGGIGYAMRRKRSAVLARA